MNAPSRPERGQRPWASAFKVVLWCLAVGAVLAFLGLGPTDIWTWIWHQVEAALHNLRAVLGTVGSYLALGAGVVLPVYGVHLLLQFLRNRRDRGNSA